MAKEKEKEKESDDTISEAVAYVGRLNAKRARLRKKLAAPKEQAAKWLGRSIAKWQSEVEALEVEIAEYIPREHAASISAVMEARKKKAAK